MRLGRSYLVQKSVPVIVVILFLGVFQVSAAGFPNGCTAIASAPIWNFCEVTPAILWRGARPDREGAAWLIERGVRTIVNLELLHDDRDIMDKLVLSKTGKYEVDYFRIRDWEPNVIINRKLLDEHVARFLAIIDRAPKPVYVHCRSGQNRTGIMVAAYRILRDGKEVENGEALIDKAIEEMKGFKGIWSYLDAKYIRGLSSERQDEIRRRISYWQKNLKRESRIICDKGKCSLLDD